MADIESERDIFDSTVEADASPDEGPARDDQGRFAARETAQQEAEPEPEQPEQPQREEAPEPEPEQRSQNRIPVAELQAERQRRQQYERDLQTEREARIRLEAQLQAFAAQQQGAPQQRQEPTPRPDLFENPDGFLQHGIQQAVGPIQSEIGQLREFYSQREAVREHGQETVQAAYQSIAQGMQSRDPEVLQVYARAMQSFDPYGEIVKWHQQKQTIAQVGNDPNAWFEKRLQETVGDPAGRERLLALINGGTAPPPQSRGGAPLINLPSVNRASGGNPRTTAGPASEEDIFHAAPSRMGRQG
jgi:hypothetical protein